MTVAVRFASLTGRVGVMLYAVTTIWSTRGATAYDTMKKPL